MSRVIDAPEVVTGLRESISARYPDSFEAVHRSLMTVRGRQFNLDGYLRVDGETGHRLLVTAGLGNAIFELFWPIDGDVEIKRSSGLLDDEVLLAGPGVDILQMYFRVPSSSAGLVSSADDVYVLEELRGSLLKVRYIFDKSSRNLLAYEELKRGKARYRIEFHDYSESVLEGFSIASRIRISNARLGYVIDIRLIDMKSDLAITDSEESSRQR